MDSLPYEVLLIVAKHLAPRDIICGLGATCKQFHAFTTATKEIEEYWRYIVVSRLVANAYDFDIFKERRNGNLARVKKPTVREKTRDEYLKVIVSSFEHLVRNFDVSLLPSSPLGMSYASLGVVLTNLDRLIKRGMHVNAPFSCRDSYRLR